MELKKIIEGMKTPLKVYFARYREKKWIGLLLLLGILLLMIPQGEEEVVALSTDSEESYSFQLAVEEEKLSLALSQIEGAGEVTVLLSVQSGSRLVLAEEREFSEDMSSMEENTSPLVLDKDNVGEDVVALQEIYPSYVGALVISDGGDNPSVRLALTEAVAALTGLGTNKISICNRGK